MYTRLVPGIVSCNDDSQRWMAKRKARIFDSEEADISYVLRKVAAACERTTKAMELAGVNSTRRMMVCGRGARLS